MNDTINRTEYRIVSRPPGAQRYTFRHFTGALQPTFDMAMHRLEHARKEAPGWDYKVQLRHITITKGKWTRT